MRPNSHQTHWRTAVAFLSFLLLACSDPILDQEYVCYPTAGPCMCSFPVEGTAELEGFSCDGECCYVRPYAYAGTDGYACFCEPRTDPACPLPAGATLVDACPPTQLLDSEFAFVCSEGDTSWAWMGVSEQTCGPSDEQCCLIGGDLTDSGIACTCRDRACAGSPYPVAACDQELAQSLTERVVENWFCAFSEYECNCYSSSSPSKLVTTFPCPPSEGACCVYVPSVEGESEARCFCDPDGDCPVTDHGYEVSTCPPPDVPEESAP